MHNVVTFIVVFSLTLVIIHLSIHLRIWFIENRIDFYNRVIKLNNLIKYKLLRWFLTIVQSLESSEIADDGTLGLLLIKKIKKSLVVS